MTTFRSTASALIFGFFLTNLNAQNPGDTIEIRTYRYNQTRKIDGWSGVQRDTTINFNLPSGITFSKILMTYNMRCRDGLVSTFGDTWRGCGELDFSCNTYIHDPTRINSVLERRSKYRVAGISGDIFGYRTNPTYDYYEYEQTKLNLNSFSSEMTYMPISGTDAVGYMFPAQKSAKSYHLYTADELKAEGLNEGPIHGISLPILGSDKKPHFLKIRIKDTTISEFKPCRDYFYRYGYFQ